MVRIRPWILVFAGTCAAFAGGGCGRRPVPVRGVVTFDGKPLAHACVMFIPQEPGGRDARGFTDADGVFQLSTFRPRDGAFPGLYKVTVTFSEPVAVSPKLKTAEDVQKAMVKDGASRKASVVIPPIYSQPDRTILKHRVPEDGEVKLELKNGKR
jgi:hypothetical protein